MDATETYDVVVVGGGAVGENAADRAGRTGLSVALVESELVGGECSYWACMPSKALLRPGAARAAARGVPGVGDPGPLYPAAVLAWRDQVTHDWDDASQVEWLEGAGIALVRGHARLAGERVVDVVLPDGGARRLTARRAVIVATGSVPVLPEADGIAAAEPWSSREATAAEAVPESLVLVGGGVVATEMATAYADLGAHVTVLARGGLLSAAEPFAGEAVAASLREAGVDLRLGVDVRKVERPADGGPVTVTFAGDAGKGSVTADELLVATGRAPRTADLGVESVGLEPGAALEVDEDMAVHGVAPAEEGGPWLYACGDVTGRSTTTHHGKYQARVAGDVVAARFAPSDADDAPAPPPAEPAAWSRYAATADHRARTQVVFTRPQVAWVGPTEREAREAGLPVRAVDYDLSWVAGATVTSPRYAGTARVLVDTERQVLVGATFVGPDAGEMLHAATIAVVGQVPLDRLWHAVPAYPTMSEVWLRFLEEYGL